MKSAKILIVEDDIEMREELSDLLSAEDMEVVASSTGLEGKRLVESGDYSLVLLDLKLPDMEGTELLRHIKSKTSARVLVITGRPLDSELEQQADAGDRIQASAIALADDVIEKPFRIHRLMDVIRRLISESDHPAS
jgi:DNA-binding response OmpR family regulator